MNRGEPKFLIRHPEVVSQAALQRAVHEENGRRDLRSSKWNHTGTREIVANVIRSVYGADLASGLPSVV